MKVLDNLPQKDKDKKIPPASAHPGLNTPPRPGAAAKTAKKKLPLPAIIIIVIAVVMALVVAGLGFLVWRKYHSIDQAVYDANQLYRPAITETVSDAPEDDANTTVTVGASSEKLDPKTGVISEFNALKATNEDTIGHINIPGTKLETPVVQYKDNSYYLQRNFFGKSELGVPFADCRATISPDYMSNNITIYGHAAANGTYFSALKSYRTADYYKAHPLVSFDTIYGKGIYKVLGAFLVKVQSENVDQSDPELFNYHDLINMTEEQFTDYMEQIQKRSYFSTDVDTIFGDQLITLSTCDDQIDASVGTPYRMVVVARKVRPGESTAVNTAAAKPNVEMILPQAWVDKYKKLNPYQ